MSLLKESALYKKIVFVVSFDGKGEILSQVPTTFLEYHV